MKDTTAWCDCGDAMENCHSKNTEAHAAAINAGITEDHELWKTYYCFGCNQLYKLTKRKPLTFHIDADGYRVCDGCGTKLKNEREENKHRTEAEQ